MTAQHLLSLIESAAPDDTAKLDEIDKETWFYIYQPKDEVFMRRGILWTPIAPKYTRSRDALKAIRPEGWSLSIYYAEAVKDSAVKALYLKNGHTVDAQLPTEELAELHAIIQAIAFERTKI